MSNDYLAGIRLRDEEPEEPEYAESEIKSRMPSLHDSEKAQDPKDSTVVVGCLVMLLIPVVIVVLWVAWGVVDTAPAARHGSLPSLTGDDLRCVQTIERLRSATDSADFAAMTRERCRFRNYCGVWAFGLRISREDCAAYGVPLR